MKIIFMGTPDFAVPSLDILVKNNYQVVAVVTSTDSMGGRGNKQLIQSPIKKYAEAHNIPVLQPVNLKAQSFIDELKGFNADIQIVVAFRMLPEVVWDMPPLGTYNLHGSLLPAYRGAAPIHHAVMNGDSITGVTSFKLKHQIDTGDILIKRTLDIGENENTGSVHDRMMVLGSEVILDTVKMIASGDYSFIPQDDAIATNAPKIFHNICKIDFLKDVSTVHNFIRGLSPFPGAWCVIDNKEMKVFTSTKEEIIDNILPNTIITDQKKMLKIKCKDGYIYFNEVKPEGKKLMPISEFLNGHKINSGEVNH